jgi:hypothetical protein
MVEIVIPEKSNIYVYLGLVSLFGLVLVFSSHKEELCSLTHLIVYVWPVYFRLPSPYYVCVISHTRGHVSRILSSVSTYRFLDIG